MAIMQGITDKLSGKMGSAVFRVRSGQQVVAPYNPIVKNPNTQGQQNTRAALTRPAATLMKPGSKALTRPAATLMKPGSN